MSLSLSFSPFLLLTHSHTHTHTNTHKDTHVNIHAHAVSRALSRALSRWVSHCVAFLLSLLRALTLRHYSLAHTYIHTDINPSTHHQQALLLLAGGVASGNLLERLFVCVRVEWAEACVRVQMVYAQWVVRSKVCVSDAHPGVANTQFCDLNLFSSWVHCQLLPPGNPARVVYGPALARRCADWSPTRTRSPSALMPCGNPSRGADCTRDRVCVCVIIGPTSIAMRWVFFQCVCACLHECTFSARNAHVGATLCGLCCAAKNRANASVRMHASACASMSWFKYASTHAHMHVWMCMCSFVKICPVGGRLSGRYWGTFLAGIEEQSTWSQDKESAGLKLLNWRQWRKNMMIFFLIKSV